MVGELAAASPLLARRSDPLVVEYFYIGSNMPDYLLGLCWNLLERVGPTYRVYMAHNHEALFLRARVVAAFERSLLVGAL